MAKQNSTEEEINWDEVPPIGGLLMLIFIGGIFLNMDSSGDMLAIRALSLFGSVIGVGYFGFRFKQIYDEEGLRRAVQWSTKPPADRTGDDFSSPDLGSVIPERKKTSNKGGLKIQDFRSMGEYEFENLVGDVWKERGWKTHVTRASNDEGIDIVAEKEQPYHQKVLIQAKRYSEGNKVGSKEVQQYYSLKDQEDNVDQVLIITTSSFTKPAERLAQKLNVKLIDGHDFLEIYQKHMEDNE